MGFLARVVHLYRIMISAMKFIAMIALLIPFVSASVLALKAEERLTMTDIEYARVQEKPLLLDLYKASSQQTGPLIIYIHGGAWRSGSKKEMPLKDLLTNGCPIASVEYRLSTEARFPAPVHDIKAAIRFLRARQSEFNINASKIVVAGSSAGGHLAALVGVTNGNPELEGNEGDFVKESSAVQGIISFYGAANLTTILAQSTPHGLSVRVPALELLLGGSPESKAELARLASPVFHVDKGDPPLLLLHGDQDAQMPVNQALELQGAYETAGCKVRLEILHGAGHGGSAFYDARHMAIVQEFLRQLMH